ncbi:helix-turn-helix domain-containing protein [Cupriavidus sp. WKF15]|uniref:helix-turn-helix domain-containing protein n=1 Tax=Cupriavidus sp. WKF15 TaxID=3032282 RepID=UPI0023E0E689|nr:helix-turn-helix domain-containing protein [Cupriavidus sp. WKF15]WER47304.1 helix-turn-helix domain-containing protein [Cupriavidus sp. WKF15]
MQFQLGDASDIGAIVRASRKANGMRQDDAAGAIGVSENFMVRVENGAEGIRWGKLFQVLSGLGIRIVVDVPEAAAPLVGTERDKLRQRQARSRRRQASAGTATELADKDGHG